MSNPYSKDWFLFGQQLAINGTRENATIVFTESTSGTKFTVTLAESGLYYPHKSSSSEYPGLFAALKTAIDAESTANTFTFEAATPTDSTKQLYSGVQLVGDSDAFTLNFSDPAWSLDPRLLGFPADQSTDVSSSTAGSNEVVRSEFMLFSMWRSVCLNGANHASAKRRDKSIAVNDSHDDEEDRFSMVWKTKKLRPIRYQFVKAAHVFAGAADEADFAVVADVAHGDDHNALEYLWEAFRKNQKVIVCHNVGDVWDLQFLTHTYEVLRRRGDWSDTFQGWLSDQILAGERYSVTLDCTVIDNKTAYGH